MADGLVLLARNWPPAVQEALRLVDQSSNFADRRKALDQLIDQLGVQRTTFVLRFVNLQSVAARRLSLEIIARDRQPPKELIKHASGTLGERKIPLHIRVAAARTMLRTTGQSGTDAASIIRALVSGLSRRRVLDRIEPIAQRLGNPPAFDVVRAELYDRQKLRCPRCGTMERRSDMSAHLWNRHLLLLDGHKARSPFQILDNRLNDPDPMAVHGEFNRALLARGFQDDEALEYLTEQAQERHESLCPKCYSFVSLPEPPMPPPANLSNRRLSADGCSVEIDEHGWRPQLRIETFGRVIHSGPKPDSSWSPSIWRWASVACAMLAIWAAALLPVPWHAVTGLALLGEALLFLFWATRLQSRPRNTVDRLIDDAWKQLVPELPPNMSLARISLASRGRGAPAARAETLNAVLPAMETAARARAIPGVALGPVWWLHADDQRRKGRDVLPTLAGRIGSCFAGDLPMTCAAAIGTLIESVRRTTAEAARFRALLCDQAFAHGLEVWDIMELTRAFPVLGRMMMTNDLDGLARLRLLWERRNSRPWSSCGPAVTVFELARYPVIAALALATAPDVLLYQPLPPPGPNDAPLPLLMCGRGMAVGQVVIREKPNNFVVRHRNQWQGGGFELRIGSRRLKFTHDPSELATRLRHWAGYWFDQFLPEVDHVLKFRATNQLAELIQPLVVHCPLCGLEHVPVTGQVGFVPTIAAAVR